MPLGSGRPPEAAADTEIPVRTGPPPKLPKLDDGRRWHPEVVKWWRQLWSCWWVGLFELPHDLPALYRLAQLRDKLHRSMDGETTTVLRKDIEHEVPIELSGSEHTAMSSLEAAFGLTPRARQVLGWDKLRPRAGKAAPAATRVGNDDRRARLSSVG